MRNNNSSNSINSNNINNSNINMESYYEDNQQFPGGQQSSSSNSNNNNNNGNNLKRPATLELKQPQRKQKFNSSVTGTVLNSPDFQLLKFASPELEKIMTGQLQIPTPTPSILYPQKVTTEQEEFVKGFEGALLSLQQNKGNSNSDKPSKNNLQQAGAEQQQQPVVSQTVTSSTHTMSGGEITYTNLDFPVAIKDEPQPVSQSPPLSPIDMENQERIKLERKRLRNRVAASKCRRRKLERISKLEDRVKNLKTENSDLGSIVFNLKQHVVQLKEQVIQHVNSGCKINM